MSLFMLERNNPRRVNILIFPKSLSSIPTRVYIHICALCNVTYLIHVHTLQASPTILRSTEYLTPNMAHNGCNIHLTNYIKESPLINTLARAFPFCFSVWGLGGQRFLFSRKIMHHIVNLPVQTLCLATTLISPDWQLA
ncbi:hypothetical protein U1Q18_052859 [Sarracenia purpurea var. burkii]